MKREFNSSRSCHREVEYFEASTELVTDDKPVELFWQVTNATQVWIDHNIGEVPVQGLVKVKLGKPMDTYTLTAIGPTGIAKKTLNLTQFPVPLHKKANVKTLKLAPETVAKINREVPEFFWEYQESKPFDPHEEVFLERPSIRREIRQIINQITFKVKDVLKRYDLD